MPAAKKSRSLKKAGKKKRPALRRQPAKKRKPVKKEAEKRVFKPGHGIIAAILIGVLIFSAVSVLSGADKEVIMITDSKACKCVKVRCISMEEQVREQLSKSKAGAKFTLIELKDEKRSKPLMDKYTMGMVPCLVVVDKNDSVVYSAGAFNFNTEEFSAVLKN